MKEPVEEILNSLKYLCAREAQIELITDTGAGRCVPHTELLYFTTNEKGRVVVATSGETFTLRPSETLAGLADRLKSHPRFVRTHSRFIVNLERAESVTPTPGVGHVLTLRGAPGVELPITTVYKKKVREFLKLPSLDHVVPWNEQMAAILAEKLRRFEKDIRLMKVEELVREFSDSTGTIVIKQLMGNIIWQAYNWIKEKKIPQFEGNIRSFWYSPIKPVIARLGIPTEDHYKTLSAIFAQYTAEYRLFKYKDFGFADDNEKYRDVGKVNPHVIVYAEKTGHWKTLEILHEQKDVSIIALGGQPSQLTTEYFVDTLEKVIPLSEQFYAFGVTDFDPAGWIIAESFIKQLQVQGIRKIKSVYLIHPKYFSEEEIEINKYPVPQSTQLEQTKVKKWMRKGGGINGEAYGLEADAMPREKLRTHFLECAGPYLKEVTVTRRGKGMLERYGRADRDDIR